MKERNSASNYNSQSNTSSNLNSSSSASSSSSSGNNVSTIKSANTTTTTSSSVTTATPVDSANSDSSQNFLSPYNSNNFMAPPIGGIVKCVTCLGTNVQGKVMAYDQQTKMLALRSPTSKPGYYDYAMVNVAWCSGLEVVEEPIESPEPLSNLNINKVKKKKFHFKYFTHLN